MAAQETRDRLLDAAEAVFAEEGFAAASLRTITGRAGANLAAVHYHFGSKEALYGAVFARRVEPINRERLRRLDALEGEAGGRPLPVAEVLRAFVEPACSIVGADEPSARFLRLLGRLYSEPGAHWHPLKQLMEPVKERFVAAFRRSLPELDPLDVFWRMYFVIGALSHTLAAGPLLGFFSDGACDGDRIEDLVGELVPFLAGGMSAPSASRARRTTR